MAKKDEKPVDLIPEPTFLDMPLTKGQYNDGVTQKKSVFLHHTAGLNAKSAIPWWNQTPEKIGTAFLIERDGTIIRAFDPKGWAWHLGIHNGGYFDKSGIGIEIGAAGPIRLVDGKYIFYPLWPSKVGAKEVSKEDTCTLDKPFRGELIYHKYTDEQVKALVILLNWIYKNFPDIKWPKEFTAETLEYNADVAGKNIDGLWAHTTVRKDKSDIFPQPSLIKAVDEFVKGLKRN